jgi:hypothetical protein
MYKESSHIHPPRLAQGRQQYVQQHSLIEALKLQGHLEAAEQAEQEVWAEDGGVTR